MIVPIHEPVRWFTPALVLSWDAGSSTWLLSNGFGAAADQAWTVTANTATYFTANLFQTIDLSGLQQNFLTFNPLSYFIQRWNPPAANLVTSGSALVTASVAQHWVTSTKPIPTTFNNGEVTYSQEDGPSYDELVGDHYQSWVSDTTGPSREMVLRDSQTLGTLQATAAGTLYTLTRVAWQFGAGTPAAPNNTTSIGPAVVTMAQEVVKEKDLEYIMRVKRAYDS